MHKKLKTKMIQDFAIAAIIYFFGMGWLVPTLTRNDASNFFLTDNPYVIIAHITFTLIMGVIVIIPILKKNRK